MLNSNLTAHLHSQSRLSRILHTIAALTLLILVADTALYAENKELVRPKGGAPNIVLIMADDK